MQQKHDDKTQQLENKRTRNHLSARLRVMTHRLKVGLLRAPDFLHLI
jgi:hypothetical protein